MGNNAIVIAGCLTLTAALQAQAPQLRASPADQESRLVYCVRPIYPKLAKQARIQGTVELSALIDETGRVKNLRLIRGHPLLVKAAFNAVKQWRYRPAMYNGVPVAVRATIAVTFSLGMDENVPPNRQASTAARFGTQS